MKPTNIIATIFGTLCSIGSMFFIVIFIMRLAMGPYFYTTYYLYIVQIVFIAFLSVSAIGSIVSGILQLVFQSKADKLRGIMIAAGVLNIIGVPIIGAVFSLICAIKISKVDTSKKVVIKKVVTKEEIILRNINKLSGLSIATIVFTLLGIISFGVMMTYNYHYSTHWIILYAVVLPSGTALLIIGIIQLCWVNKVKEIKGLTIATGIVNIFSGVFIVGAVLSLINIIKLKRIKIPAK